MQYQTHLHLLLAKTPSLSKNNGIERKSRLKLEEKCIYLFLRDFRYALTLNKFAFPGYSGCH